MPVRPGVKSFIDRKYSTEDLKILDPNIFVKDFPLDPSGKFLKTNNFVQQGINRLLGFDHAEKRWVRVRVDDDGYLQPKTILWSRQAMDVKVLDAVSVPATSLVTHVGVDIQEYTHISCIVSADQACTIYVQGSDDNVNWYDFKRSHDTDTTWSCSSEKIWFKIDSNTHYIRILVYNTAAAAATVTVVLMVSV